VEKPTVVEKVEITEVSESNGATNETKKINAKTIEDGNST